MSLCSRKAEQEWLGEKPPAGRHELERIPATPVSQLGWRLQVSLTERKSQQMYLKNQKN